MAIIDIKNPVDSQQIEKTAHHLFHTPHYNLRETFYADLQKCTHYKLKKSIDKKSIDDTLQHGMYTSAYGR